MSNPIITFYSQNKLSGPTFDADAQAFFTAAAITDATQKTAVNTMVTSMKTNNLWSKFIAIYPFVGGSANSHKYNLKDPRDLNVAYRLSFVGTFSHTSQGVNADSGQFWADTYINTNTLAFDKLTLAMYINATASNASLSCYDSGAYDGTNLGLLAGCSGNTTFYFGAGSTSWVTNVETNTIGFYAGTNTGSSGTSGGTSSLYKNGSIVKTSASNFARVNQNLTLFANNVNGVKGIDMSSRRQAFYAVSNDFLTDTDMANLYTIVQTYQTALGRQV